MAVETKQKKKAWGILDSAAADEQKPVYKDTMEVKEVKKKKRYATDDADMCAQRDVIVVRPLPCFGPSPVCQSSTRAREFGVAHVFWILFHLVPLLVLMTVTAHTTAETAKIDVRAHVLQRWTANLRSHLAWA
ncbi:hypothetical protein BKA62DRAFT_775477 [Auriculariales sp. MPI-PUGE-AT-0066]|nr:hypothetical protein BKA62DRAFT_775477 [Auriculariales sp. MPI-PUGE-AT-0066]